MQHVVRSYHCREWDGPCRDVVDGNKVNEEDDGADDCREQACSDQCLLDPLLAAKTRIHAAAEKSRHRCSGRKDENGRR